MSNNNNDKNERIFVLGSTGNVGSVVVNELLKNNIPVTAYTRSPQKFKETEEKQKGLLTVIQGDYIDLTPFHQAIQGHTRLFLLVPDMEDMGDIKITLGEKAYEAGVKQIVDVSVQTTAWREYQALLPHQEAETALFHSVHRKKNKGRLVSLRPSNFMSNLLFVSDTIQHKHSFMDAAGPDEYQEYISPLDIGQVAARVLMDPVEKHGDTGYELIGDVKTPQQRATLLSKLLGRTIRYEQVAPQVVYDMYLQLGLGHALSFCAASYQAKNNLPTVSRGLSILLGRDPESVEEWYKRNKDAFISS
ncbi:hypothetical protein BDA99DRAFT_511742 [Phascolomyces articulosus]|uniref:NmrA-like domain-containing protein n=1 Tax=Phascolomyces articulosus TaxID=60185 RepID=A0AAD5K8S6_9FUNG|nr:hypothetical protein BDA99DRAFT_511742 [Phascolomyces articulosus]